MFTEFQSMQFAEYNNAVDYYSLHPERLIEIEKFVMNEILHFIDLHIPEITRDYNEASYLFSFWENYPPLERGRAPMGDQYPWMEVGEQVFGSKLSRYFAANFGVKDAGLPSGSDDRCIISSERIREILGITNSVWVFIDIKSAGPRDNFNHAVMSPYQISGSGIWNEVTAGVKNDPIQATGTHVSHDFLCSLSPIYVLSDGTVAPLVTFAVKPVYRMLQKDSVNIGQPLQTIKVACIPNGLLLTRKPNYIAQHPRLFFPGKDVKTKDFGKKRARVSFDVLKEIDIWRVAEKTV